METTTETAYGGVRDADRVRRWFAWPAILVSMPLVLVGLWISLTKGETIYRFCVEFGEDFSTSEWRIINACRAAAWAMGPLALVQVVLAVLVAVGRTKRTGMLLALWGGGVVLFALTLFWVLYMLPVQTLMDSVRPQR
jgi:hypothetical protein